MDDGMKKTPDMVDFFTDKSVVNDPNPYYHSTRSKCPVLREPYHGAVMVTGYDEAMTVFSNKELFSSCVTVTGPIPPLPFKPEEGKIREQIAAHRHEMPWTALLATLDGQEHIDARTMLTSIITHTRLKKNEEYMQMLAGQLVDKFIDRGRCEFVSEYAHALSTLVIADLLGVPEKDRDELLVLLGPNPTQMDGDPDFKMGPDPLCQLQDKFVGYMTARRGNSQGDLMSDLANGKFKDGTQPDLSVPIRLGKFLFGAGQDTSARLMAGCLQILGDNPDLQKRLRANRGLIQDFIEEALRIDPPVKTLSRLTTAKTKVGDMEIPAGTVVTVCSGATNRDPRRFDHPDEFDLDRTNARDHLSFSRGAHACPGAPLARAEARITLELMFDRTKDIRISDQHHGPAGGRRYEYEPTYLLRGLRALHLEFVKA
jgi:cytochrome P450